jgi:hypothetical protein
VNLEQALEVLNKNRHRGSDRWHVVKHLRHTRVAADPDAVSHSWLLEFEVVAIAEKYEREGERASGRAAG